MLLCYHFDIFELVDILGHALPGPLDEIVLCERPGCPGVTLLAVLGHVHGNVKLHILALLPREVLDREEDHVCVVPVLAPARASRALLSEERLYCLNRATAFVSSGSRIFPVSELRTTWSRHKWWFR